MDLFHAIFQYSLPPGNIGIFDPSLSIPKRYLFSSLSTISIGLAIHFATSGVYQLMTVFSMVLLGQSPEQWPPLSTHPWLSESLGDFWGKRWHQLFRDVFVRFGYTPFSIVGSRVGGEDMGKAFGTLGAFIVSGILHQIGTWGMGNGTEFLPDFVFFFMQGVGVIFERAFLRQYRGGLVSRVWTLFWVVGWGNMLIDCWVRKGMGMQLFSSEGFRPGKYVVDHILRIAGIL